MRTYAKRISALLLALMMLLSVTACAAPQNDPAGVALPVENGAELGAGSKTLSVEVIDAEGQKVSFTVHTAKTTVGEALQELGIIDGDEGDYGLYIKSVNGITADYQKDGSYWAFYINGDYALTGADMTDIQEGVVYTFRVEYMVSE